VENLKLGDHYVYLDGVWVLIEDMQLQPFTGIVYNLSVESVHNYIAENLLVHNVIDKIQKPN
jgi:intein/homing endonuclease